MDHNEMGEGNSHQEKISDPEDGHDPIKVNAKPYQIVMLCCFSAALGVGYSAQSAYVTPILAQLGMPLRYLTFVWCSSPIVGLITQPFIGSMSDGCTSKWGRRRPFILAFAIGILLGLLLIGFGRDIGLAILPGKTSVAIALIIIGNGILDYGLDTSQGPARAYLYDVTPEGQEQRAHRICTILMGLANAVGYCICAIDWDELFRRQDGTTPITSVQFVFLISGILSTIAFIVCLFSVHEIPLSKANKQKQLKSQQDVTDDKPSLQNDHDQDVKVITENGEKDNKEKSVSCLRSVYNGFFRLPKELLVLVLINTLSWTGYITFFVIYTDFIGIEIYKGDPTAATNTTEYALYTVGVKTGSWALVGFAIVTGVYALALDVIERYVSARILLLFGYGGVGGLVILMSQITSLPLAVAIGCSVGINFATMFSIPYALVGEYHVYFKNDPRWKDRGFGVDSAILNSCFYVAQLVVAFSVGGIIEAAGSRNAAVLFGGVCYVASGLMSIGITSVPKTECEETESEPKSPKLQMLQKETSI
ncbi:Membrane-associated transporter protein [Trichoplax sp. H2]|nr:Membrane-associated transporter protein [Trichoplax sp. H2]|eukprot:RDD45624.1 Membrane-associated transporter protein [Trichoplax sp. H2]